MTRKKLIIGMASILLLLITIFIQPSSTTTTKRSGQPAKPKDIRLLPLSNTELDVDILPSDSIAAPGDPLGEPTRYNISYEFRVWKKKTNVQKISIKHSTGIVISFMRMVSPPCFYKYENKSMEIVDYVYNIMSKESKATDDRGSDPPVPINTCQGLICSFGLKKIEKFKNVVTSTYDIVYHGYSHFTPFLHSKNSFLSNVFEIKLIGQFARGAIIAVNKNIIVSKLGETISDHLVASFTFHPNEWNLLEFYGFESCCQRTVISMEYRQQTKNITWTEWKIWDKANLPLSGTRPSFGKFRNTRHLRELKKRYDGTKSDVKKSEFRLSYNSLYTNYIPFNATSSDIFQALHGLNTTGHLMVSHDDEKGVGNVCILAGWCSWQITFITNVLYEKPHLPVLLDTDRLRFPDPDISIVDLGHVKMTGEYETQYNGKTSVTPASLGPNIPRRFRLHGVTGAKYLPFTVGVQSRNFIGYGEEKIIDARFPDPPELLGGDIIGDRQINLNIRGPKNNYGAMITKYIVKWKSMKKMGKQVQELKFTGQDDAWEEKINEVYNSTDNENAKLWQRGFRIDNTCGEFGPMIGGYNIAGEGAVLFRNAHLPPHTGVKIDFNLILIDRWLGEKISVYVDNIQVWQRRPHLIHDKPIGHLGIPLGSQCGLNEINDRLVPVSFQIPHTGTKLNVTITTSLTVSPSIASYGVQGLNVSYTQLETYFKFNNYVFPLDKNNENNIRENDWWFNRQEILDCGKGLICNTDSQKQILGVTARNVAKDKPNVLYTIIKYNRGKEDVVEENDEVSELVDELESTKISNIHLKKDYRNVVVRVDLETSFNIETVHLLYDCTAGECDRHIVEIYLIDELEGNSALEEACQKGFENCKNAGGDTVACVLSKTGGTYTGNAGNCFGEAGKAYRYVYININWSIKRQWIKLDHNVYELYPYWDEANNPRFNLKDINIFAKIEPIMPVHGTLLKGKESQKTLKTWPVSILDVDKTKVMNEIKVSGEEYTSRNDWFTSFNLQSSNDQINWKQHPKTFDIFPGKSYTCAKYTYEYCFKKGRNATTNKGCYPMLEKTTDNCIYDYHNEKSPCHFKDCVISPKSAACSSHVANYCSVVNTNDPGCNAVILDTCVGGTSTNPLCKQAVAFQSQLCPFRNDTQTSPCLSPLCVNNLNGNECKRFVRNYCNTNEGKLDAACNMYRPVVSTCVFDLNAVGTPCLHHHCKDKGIDSIDCRDYVRHYCLNINSADTGCFFGIIDSNLLTCPYGKDSNTPCYERICMKDGSTTDDCRESIRDYCLRSENINTNACSGSQVDVIIDDCPFDKTKAGTPCHQATCRGRTAVGMDARECRISYKDYCSVVMESGSTPQGCILGTITTKITCPYEGEGNPCRQSVCYSTGSSIKACRDAEKNWCDADPSRTGCSGGTVDTSVDNCPFNLDVSNSPCKSIKCARGPAVSQPKQCNDDILAYCKSYQDVTPNIVSDGNLGMYIANIKDGDDATKWTVQADPNLKTSPVATISFSTSKQIAGITISWLHQLQSFKLEASPSNVNFETLHEYKMSTEFGTIDKDIVLSLRASDYSTGPIVQDTASSLKWRMSNGNFISTVKNIVIWNTGENDASYALKLEPHEPNLFPGPLPPVVINVINTTHELLTNESVTITNSVTTIKTVNTTNVTITNYYNKTINKTTTTYYNTTRIVYSVPEIPEHRYTLIAWVKGLSRGDTSLKSIFKTTDGTSSILSRKRSGNNIVYSMFVNNKVNEIGSNPKKENDDWELLVLEATDYNTNSSKHSLYVGSVDTEPKYIGQADLIGTSIFELQIGEICNAKNGWDVLNIQIWVSIFYDC